MKRRSFLGGMAAALTTSLSFAAELPRKLTGQNGISGAFASPSQSLWHPVTLDPAGRIGGDPGNPHTVTKELVGLSEPLPDEFMHIGIPGEDGRIQHYEVQIGPQPQWKLDEINEANGIVRVVTGKQSYTYWPLALAEEKMWYSYVETEFSDGSSLQRLVRDYRGIESAFIENRKKSQS